MNHARFTNYTMGDRGKLVVTTNQREMFPALKKREGERKTNGTNTKKIRDFLLGVAQRAITSLLFPVFIRSLRDKRWVLRDY